ncbi:MAG TPA: oxygenase MpaB family protein [Ktedonobacteraceae bacterium]|nr:oxygenase MpaB family protein [Ktedonobacteraceae bacterium]
MLDNGYFGKESVTWKVARESILNLGGGRAVLMQLAHPLVAAGVSEHSRYMSDPLGRAESTFMLGQLLTFGSVDTARRAARTINRLHTHVHGTLPLEAGDYAPGAPYHARAPELLLWVHATLIDTALLIYPLFIGPLSEDEQEQYYQESKTLAQLLGLSASDMPATLADLRCYIHDMVYSNRLAATPQARELARTVLYPPIPSLFRPLLHLNLQVTCALLPQPVREIYGLEWGSKHQRAFDLSTAGLRAVLPHLPAYLRVLPVTHTIMQQGSAGNHAGHKKGHNNQPANRQSKQQAQGQS